MMKFNGVRLAKSRHRVLAMLVCIGAAQAWAPLTHAGQAHVTGTVSYRERIALPPNYIVRVELADVSRQDAPSVPIAAVELTPQHQVPVAFDLAYDDANIDPRFTYAVRAQILVGGRLIFTSTLMHQVITRGHPNTAEIILQRVASPKTGSQAAPPTLTGEWLVEDIGGRGVLDNLRSTLRFGSNGQASGQAGCNNFSGSVILSESELRFGPLAATRKGCLPAIADQEQKYFAALAAVRVARIEGGILVLAGADGARLLKLTRL
jgi:putative lipoprotein